MKNKRTGLFLGRFQPLHAGHIGIIERAFRENDKTIVCIGSSQKSEPFSFAERKEIIEKQMEILGHSKDDYSIVRLNDPEPMEIWPSYVKKACKIGDETTNTFYRGEEIPCKYVKDLKDLGFKIKIVEKKPFYYKAPDGFYYLVSSATEIRNIHKKLDIEIQYRS